MRRTALVSKCPGLQTCKCPFQTLILFHWQPYSSDFPNILKATHLFCSTFPVLIYIMCMSLGGKHGSVSYWVPGEPLPLKHPASSVCLVTACTRSQFIWNMGEHSVSAGQGDASPMVWGSPALVFPVWNCDLQNTSPPAQQDTSPGAVLHKGKGIGHLLPLTEKGTLLLLTKKWRCQMKSLFVYFHVPRGVDSLKSRALSRGSVSWSLISNDLGLQPDLSFL